MFSNEDVTIGAWMLAMNVHHENNLELCSKECTETSIAVWDIPKCSGLCSLISFNFLTLLYPRFIFSQRLYLAAVKINKVIILL